MDDRSVREETFNMTQGPTVAETELFDEIGNLADALWHKSKGTVGSLTDPKVISVILFKRLRSHYIGYTALWKNGCFMEGEIIVRSAIEAAICISANSNMDDSFPRLMRRDAAATLQGHIKLHQKNGDLDSLDKAEAALRFLSETFAEGEKPAFLNWKSLADAGGVPMLYGFYKMLSGMSSHVTGLSIIRDVEDDETRDAHAELRSLNQRNYFNMMAGAGLHGSLVHARMSDDTKHEDQALRLVGQMNELSRSWPTNAKASAV